MGTATTNRTRRPPAGVVACLILALVGTHPTAGNPMNFRDLPESIRSRVLTGAPRTSGEIPHSNFGAHTTLMQERARDEAFQDQLVEALVEGGFTWAMDYVSPYVKGHGGFDTLSPTEISDHVRDRLPGWIQYAEQLHRHEINLMVRLDVPRWKAGIHRALTAADRDKIRAFVEPVVRALGPYCRHWQYYNEPNMGNSTPQADPEHYVEWLRFVGTVVKSVQPDAVYSAPASAMLQCMHDEPYPWLRRAFDAGLTEPLDLFTYHPYRMPWVAANIPEHASEFAPWERWGSYYHQVSELRRMIREHNNGLDLPLAVTEDGLSTDITAAGEQEITWVTGAKYELRRALLDTWLGVNPRVIFVLFRGIDCQLCPYYEFQTAFNLLTPDMRKKPAYYAAQNLHAVLDGTYARNNDIDVSIELEAAPETGTARLVRTEADAVGMTPGGMEGLYVQTYTKSHPGFDELLVFFWSAEPAQNRHVRRKARMLLREPGWVAPLQIDLMAMPNAHLALKQRTRTDLINNCPDRLQPQPLNAEMRGGAIALPIEVRDYPLLIKWVRLADVTE